MQARSDRIDAVIAEALVVLMIAALPVSELRGAIPVAMGVYGFDPVTAYLLGVVGNLVPVPIVLALLEPVLALLRRSAILRRPVDWLLARTRRRYSPSIARLGAAALVLFVAIPFPATGAWTGTLIAYVFGIPFKYAFSLIALGVGIAGVIVTLATLGVIQLWG